MHSKKNFSLRKKLIFSYALVLLIFILVYSLYNYYNSSRYLKEQKMLLYKNSAEKICQNIETQLHSFSTFSTVVSSNNHIQSYFYEPPENILEELDIVYNTIVPLLDCYKALNPEILDLKLYSAAPRGEVHCDYIQYITPDQMELETSYQLEYPWQLKNDALVQHTYIFNIYKNLAEPVCYLEILLDTPALFQSTLSDSTLGFQICILGEDDKLIWSNHVEEENPSKEGQNVSITQISITNTPLTVDFSMPPAQFYAGINVDAINSTLPLLLICFASFIIFFILYSHTVDKSIQTLSGIISKIDQSNLGISIDIRKSDEIGTLVDCLNKMFGKINSQIEYIRQSKDAEKKAELEALRAQINPHFLYNTMDVINWMAIRGDTDAICNVTMLISQYYRTSLNHGEYYTTFAKELENIRSYISIQLIMHADSFDAQYDCDEKLLQNKVPNFILQPAVENAIKHGIDSNTAKKEKGLLRIILRESEGLVLVDICDNGIGLTEEQQQSLNEMLLSDSPNTGYGLRNVQERIHFACGKEYGLTLIGKPGEGCITRFRLPLCEFTND